MLSGLALALALPSVALENGLARTPPMGWMSWERFRCNVDCQADPRNCIRSAGGLDRVELQARDGSGTVCVPGTPGWMMPGERAAPMPRCRAGEPPELKDVAGLFRQSGKRFPFSEVNKHGQGLHGSPGEPPKAQTSPSEPPNNPKIPLPASLGEAQGSQRLSLPCPLNPQRAALLRDGRPAGRRWLEGAGL